MTNLLIVFVVLCILSSGFAQNYYNHQYDYTLDWQPENYDYNQDYNSIPWNKRSNYDSDYYNYKNDYSENDGDYYDSINPHWDGYNYKYHHTQDKGCVTPNGEKGRCISLNNCPALKQHSYHYHHRSRFFKESICGHTYDGPLVCCGTDYQYNKNQNPSTHLPHFSRVPFHTIFSPSYSRLTPPVSPTTTVKTQDSRRNNPVNIPEQENPSLTTTTPSSTQIKMSVPPSDIEKTTQTTQTRNVVQNSTSISISTSPESNLSNHPNFNLLPERNACGYDSFDDRLFGGNETGLSEFPWMALLEYHLNGISTGYKCGGMLINDRYILTAAHCVFGKALPKGENLLSVRLGEHDVSTNIDCRVDENNIEDCNLPPQDIGIEDIIVHPGFNDSDLNMLNDIALLRLRQVPVKNDFVQPICLPTAGEKVSPGDNLTISGWGVTEIESASEIKLKASVPYIDDNECKRIWLSSRSISDNQFCAGGSDGVSACSGDSGGAIMSLAPGTTNWYAEGIVSFGRLPCGTFPNVFTRVSSYVKWILDSIEP